MGESGCLMHAYSYPSALPNEVNQGGNPMLALGESVSFGRFMSESLAWEKWSSFSHNRYVEEAERYAQPGSVAQKRAFFEAHYKKIAARKAAALLEQQNAANNATTHDCEPEFEGGALQSSSQAMVLASDYSRVPVDDKKEALKLEAVKKDEALVEISSVQHQLVELGTGKVDEGGDFVSEPKALLNRSLEKAEDELAEGSESVESSKNKGSESELSRTSEMERPLLKNFHSNEEEASISSVSKKKSVLSTLKSSVVRKSSKVPATPAKPLAPLHLNKENSNITPNSRNPAMESTERKRWSPNSKSLSALINITPNPTKTNRGPDKASTPVARKCVNSSGVSVAPTPCKPPKTCAATPIRTPSASMISECGLPKYHLKTPFVDNRRAETPLKPISGSSTTGPKWHIFSTVSSKSLSSCKNKLQPPTLSTPFFLRTEERAAKKKQRLEEKFNAKQSQNVQQPQTQFKQRAGTEFRKLSQSFCFKARPLPDFYKAKETVKNHAKKTPLMHPQLPKLGEKPNANTTHRAVPHLASSTKSNASKSFLKKEGPKPNQLFHSNNRNGNP